MFDTILYYPLWIVPIIFVATCLLLLFLPKFAWRRAALYGLLVFGIFMIFGNYMDGHTGSADRSMIVLRPIYTLGLALFAGSFAFILGKIHSLYLDEKAGRSPVTYFAGMGVLAILVVIPFILEGVM